MRAEEFVIHLTYQCPLTCSHCCFSSDMSKTGNLSLAEVLKAIDEASRIATVRKVEFVGGDPFLHPEILEPACARARALGLSSAAVTSGYWAGSYDRAVRTLKPLVAAGLSLITLSYDDMHADFVKPKTIINAYKAARALGIQVKIAVVLEPDCTIDRAYIVDLLDAQGDDALIIYETFVNSTGRALAESSEQERDRRRADERTYLGGCSSALRHISLTAEGHLMPCCGVLPYREELSIGEFGAQPVDAAIRDAFDDPVLKWLAFEGPVEILKQITRDTDAPLSDADFDGICNACDVLFSSPRYVDLLQAALPDKLNSLAIQQAVYEAAGLYEAPGAARSAAPAKALELTKG